MKRSHQKIMTRLKQVNVRLFDLLDELNNQRFPTNSPVMMDVAKIKHCLASIVDHLDKSIQMRDDACKFFLEEDPE